MPDITVKFPDGSSKTVPKGTTALEIAKSISPRLASAALAAKAFPLTTASDGEGTHLASPLEQDIGLLLLTERDPEALQVYRHSSAHLMAAAVVELFPETKLGHGPPTATGFSSAFYPPRPFT